MAATSTSSVRPELSLDVFWPSSFMNSSVDLLTRAERITRRRSPARAFFPAVCLAILL